MQCEPFWAVWNFRVRIQRKGARRKGAKAQSGLLKLVKYLTHGLMTPRIV
jgi:hypothetical protein